MSRDISSSNQTASQGAVIVPVNFVKLELDSGAIYAHSSLGNIVWGGNTYQGVGLFGSVGTIDEDTTLARSTVNLTLSAIPTTLFSILLNEQYQGRRATIYLGYLNQTTMQLVDDPFILFRGRMDTANIEQGDTLTIQLSIESRFAAWDRPLVRRYNNADQQARYPGDKGLEFVEQTVDKQVIWGQKAP